MGRLIKEESLKYIGRIEIRKRIVIGQPELIEYYLLENDKFLYEGKGNAIRQHVYQSLSVAELNAQKLNLTK